MTRIGLKDAFAKYGAKLTNVQWSVSAWSPNDELVLSLWAHHSRKGPDRSVEFQSTTERWSGPGKNEFIENVNRAYAENRPLRVVIATTTEPERVEAGEDGSTIQKSFDVKPNWIGEVVEWDGARYIFRFVSKS
jgi:hypothetical protein